VHPQRRAPRVLETIHHSSRPSDLHRKGGVTARFRSEARIQHRDKHCHPEHIVRSENGTLAVHTNPVTLSEAGNFEHGCCSSAHYPIRMYAWIDGLSWARENSSIHKTVPLTIATRSTIYRTSFSRTTVTSKAAAKHRKRRKRTSIDLRLPRELKHPVRVRLIRREGNQQSFRETSDL